MRLVPRSLFGRIVLILFVGLTAAHLLTFVLVIVERGLAMRGMMVSYLASDVASSVALLESLPPQERAVWLPRLARRNYRFQIGEAPADSTPSTAPLSESVVREVAQALRKEVRVQDDAASGMWLALRLKDGMPLTVRLDEPRLTVSPWALGTLAAQLAMLGLCCWIAVRLATRPLSQLALAADGLQPGVTGAPLPLDGPQEVARAATAFNAMQARIREHLDERMTILASVSHDLQTPITRMRLRLDLLDDMPQRDRFQSDLTEMQSLVEEGISYARTSQAAREATCDLELRSFLDSLVCDYTDAGRPVRLTSSDPGVVRTRPIALRRLACNLVDNALKFAGEAEVCAVVTSQGAFTVFVRDRGPGVPADQLEAMMQPFVRLEHSRSRHTGGTGLGLAIAAQLARVLDGNLVLSLREGGGLEARFEAFA